MDIKTYIRPNNKKAAEKVLRKGRGAWGDFVNGAFNAYSEIDRLADYLMENYPTEIEGSAVDTAIKILERNTR
jgi:hypothetical protein